jgi:hypothetical protein
MNRLRARLVPWLCGLLWCSLCGVHAQEFRATLTGTVSDPSGAVIPNATVEAVNNSTQQKYTAKTTGSGAYYIPYILPGTYTVRATAPGFKTAEQNDVTLEASRSFNLNFKLEVGMATQTVEVTTAPPLLENANGSGGTILDAHELENVPLNGRQVYTLIGTTPGSAFLQHQFGASGYSGTRGWDVSNNYRLGGGVNTYQQFTLNGSNITMQDNGAQGTWELAPNIDALQEVNIMTTTYDARYGRTGGGTVNMVVKSGTNVYHGDAYEYLENGDLNANNFENNLNGLPRQNIHQNQFGGTIGGPIKKDKIFFFASDEQYLETIPFTTLTSVPPAYLRPQAGQGVNFTPTGYTIFDPSTTVCKAPGGTIGNCANNNYARSPFPNDTIPATRISPIGLALLNLFPQPNSGSNGLNNNFIANTPDQYNYNQPMVRLDYNTSDRTRWYSMFAFQHGTEFRNTSGFPPPAENGNIHHIRQELMASQDMTHIFSPSLVGDFKVSFSRFLDFSWNGDLAAPVNPATIGLNMPSIPTSSLKDLPQITFSQLYPQVVGNQVNNNVYNNIIFDNDWSKTAGHHTFEFGGEIAEFQYGNPQSVGSPNGSFQFGTSNTQYNPFTRNSLPGVLDGFPIASLLLGYPNSGGVDWNDTFFVGFPAFAIYGQDNWKVLPNLTLNIGLRYDVQRGSRDRYNRLNRGLCLTCLNPITNEINYPVVNAELAPYGVSLGPIYGGMEFAGVNGNSVDGYNTDWSNIEPRFGFAYQATRTTVIRGGWGTFFAVGLERGTNTGFSQSTPYISSLNGGVTPTEYFNSGTPFPNGAIPPSRSSLGLLTSLGSSFSIDFPGRRIPRSQEFSFGIQQEVPGHAVLDVRYVGNYTDRIRASFDNSGVVWVNGTMSYDQLQAGIANPNLFNQQVPNPFYGLPGIPPSSNLGSSPTISRVYFLVPLIQYRGPIGDYTDPLGKTQYNALEVKLDKRLYGVDRGLAFRLSYTWSKTMSELGYENGWPYQDPNLLKGIYQDDQTNQFALTGEWDLPIGRGSKYVATNASGILGALINHWRLDWVFSYDSGFPVALSTGYYYTCNQSWRPAGGPTRAEWINTGGPSASCWTPVPQWHLMTTPNITNAVRQPSVPDLDVTLEKNFRLTEKFNLQLRGEAQNLTNSVLFGPPDTNPGDKIGISNGNPTGFGTVAPLQYNFPRIVQVALKLLF